MKKPKGKTLEQVWAEWLDEHPDDLHVRGLYHDWLIDQGRDAEAEGQAYLIHEKKWPEFIRGEYDLHRWHQRWHWWWHRAERPKSAQLPEKAYNAIARDIPANIYETRKEAEDALVGWARENGWPSLTVK